MVGSSPRVRGEAHDKRAIVFKSGIIPAGAGRRRRRCCPRGRGGDHPRGCGEKFFRGVGVGGVEGSSPRVRGEGEVTFLSGGPRRIIPAGAGRSNFVKVLKQKLGDHPRGCGEKAKGCRFWRRALGSSPRVRGEVETVPAIFIREGIIPAGAGRSKTQTSIWGTSGDHPRGCGEKGRRRGRLGVAAGSSPRVRGEASSFSPTTLPPGIIPAGAGRSRCLQVLWRAGRDHPRGCGEKRTPKSSPCSARGSSPRVRGEGKLAPSPCGA